VSGKEGTEGPSLVCDLLLKYIKDNVGAAIGFIRDLTSSLEQAIAAANGEVPLKVVVSVYLGRVLEDVDVLMTVVNCSAKGKTELSTAMMDVVSELLMALADINAGRLDDAEGKLVGLHLTLGRAVDRLVEDCARARQG